MHKGPLGLHQRSVPPVNTLHVSKVLPSWGHVALVEQTAAEPGLRTQCFAKMLSLATEACIFLFQAEGGNDLDDSHVARECFHDNERMRIMVCS